MMTANAPWEETLSASEYHLISFFLTVAAFALAAGFIRTWVSRNEVGARYRPAVSARLAVMGIAALSYGVLLLGHRTGYDLTDAGFVPNAGAIEAFAPRFASWAVTVPVLAIELLAVCTVVGIAARRSLAIAVSGSFLMIATGYIGVFIVDSGDSNAQLLIWGGLSCVFLLLVNIVLIRAVRRSLPNLTAEAATLLRNATIVLLGGWLVFPLVAAIQLFASGSEWTVTMQVAYCAADVIVKLGFGMLVHRVAKLRTAEDVRAGEDIHPEAIWISSVKQSDAGAPVEVFLHADRIVHQRRGRPPSSMAVAADDGDALGINGVPPED